MGDDEPASIHIMNEPGGSRPLRFVEAREPWRQVAVIEIECDDVNVVGCN